MAARISSENRLSQNEGNPNYMAGFEMATAT